MPGEQPGEEQGSQAIEIGRAAEQVEAEDAEDWIDVDALKAVSAAGDEARFVRGLGQQCRDGERQHQQREALRAEDHQARQESHHGSDECSDQQSRQRLAGDMRGVDAGSVCTHAEERRMTERDDASIAQHQIER